MGEENKERKVNEARNSNLQGKFFLIKILINRLFFCESMVNIYVVINQRLYITLISR